MNTFASDVRSTQYGQGSFGIPTVSSGSGIIFGIAGAVIVLVLTCCAGYYSLDTLKSKRGMQALIYLCGPTLLGWILGVGVHFVLRFVLGGTSTGESRGPSQNNSSPVPPVTGRPPEQQIYPTAYVLQCGACGRKLRVPHVNQEIVVTCPSCQNKFSYRAPS